VRVLTILVRFGTQKYPQAENDITRIFDEQMPSIERSVIVVDNALPREVVDNHGDVVVLGGDNNSFEFSGFDRALAYVGSDIWFYDLVHFATSAFNTLHVAYLGRLDARVIGAITNRPACLGHIDCYNEPVEMLGFRSQHWIRSCFFFMPPAEVKALRSFVTIADPGRLFSGQPHAPFRDDAPVSARYIRYIVDWVTGSDIGQGVEWHSGFALTSETLSSFERKALCIMNEHLLAIRLRALGCRLIDVTWLATQLSQARHSSVPWSTNWRDQLAGRDRDALILETGVR
jgi:hypothetical protein